MKSFFVADETQMLKSGDALAAQCQVKTIIFLYGQLGAGKTTLVRGMLRGLGYVGIVKSPTYTLVESYELPQLKVFHFDLYRLHDAKELEFIGIDDYFAQQGIFLVEWPELGLDLLPQPDLTCYIQIKDQGREVRFQSHTQRGKDVLEKL